MPWISHSGHRILKQVEKQSCGYCCIAMALNKFGDGEFTEKMIVSSGLDQDGNNYSRNASDHAGASRTLIAQGKNADSWGSGTKGQHLAEVLSDHYVNAVYNAGVPLQSVKIALRTVSERAPILMLVRWFGGGGHWVLVINRQSRFNKPSIYTALDPVGEVVNFTGSIVDNRRAGPGKIIPYSPSYSKGYLGNYFVKVTGRLPIPTARGMGPTVSMADLASVQLKPHN